MLSQFSQIEMMKPRHLRVGVQVCWLRPRLGNNQGGFTLIELIMVIVIVGILAIAVAPRFLGVDVFKSRGFADQVQATLRYAQKEAIAQHRNVCVAMTASDIALTIANANPSVATSPCNTNLVLPGQSSNKISTPSASITLSAATFNFDALGKPWDVLGVTPSSVKKSIAISGANNIFVEAETGYVH
jgi:MSHA pilin protein MshC